MPAVAAVFAQIGAAVTGATITAGTGATALAGYTAAGVATAGLTAKGVYDMGKKKGSTPAAPAPIVPATAAAPVSRSNVAVKQGQRDFMKQNEKRKGYRKSIFAGETGGYTSATILQQLGGRS